MASLNSFFLLDSHLTTVLLTLGFIWLGISFVTIGPVASTISKTWLGRVHTCSGREPDSSVPGARVRFASTRAKNRPAAIRSRPVKLKPRVHTATGTVPGLAWLHVVNLGVTGWGRHVITISFSHGRWLGWMVVLASATKCLRYTSKKWANSLN